MLPRPTDAYRQTSKLVLPPRVAEAEAFIKAARLLNQAKTGSFDYDAYASALRFNQTLWTIIQADLGRDGSRLPAGLRSDILNLSLYVDKQTLKALSDPKAEYLGALVEIDRTIARGLT
jgi:flagellar protein FlaF